MKTSDWDTLTPEQIDERSNPKPYGPRFLEEEEYFKLITPQDWLIGDIVERSFVYTLTGVSGGGKTAVAQLIAFLMGTTDDKIPRWLGTEDHYIVPGRVILLAGENAPDSFRRAYAVKEDYGAQSRTRVTIQPDPVTLENYRPMIEQNCKRMGPVDLIIVDTYAAFFALSGADPKENDNAQVAHFADMLRGLTKVPGNPAVLVLCHPVKNATDRDMMVPRGGGALLAAIDGNLTLVGTGERQVELGHGVKLRGPGFEPIQIELAKVYPTEFIDKRGKPSSSVVAHCISSEQAASKAAEGRDTKEQILAALAFKAEAGMRAEHLMNIVPVKRSRIFTALKSLAEAGLVAKHDMESGVWVITKKGKERK